MIANDDDAGVALDSPTPPRRAKLTVRRLSLDDLRQSFRQGLADFARAPLYGLFFGGVYAVGGWLIVSLVFLFDLPYLAYPMALGFALIAPFVCAGTYEVSRVLERGGALSGGRVRRRVAARGKGTRLARAGLPVHVDPLGGFRVDDLSRLPRPACAEAARVCRRGRHDPERLVVPHCRKRLWLTDRISVFSITVVTPTLLVDRDIDFITAMTTSVRLVIANPFVMLVWAASIGVLLALSIATGFLGLFVVLPVLGHASWALYRRAIA